jgi:hypothetical protein
MKRRDLLPLVALVALVLGGRLPAYAAGTGSIEGTVVDQRSGQVVPGGKIRIAVVCGAVRKGAAVDGVGHFSLGGLPQGSCTLRATGGAYVTATLAVAVASGSIATVLVGVTTKVYVEQLRKEQEAQRRRYRSSIATRRAFGGGRGMAAADMRAEAMPMGEPAVAAAAPPPRPAPRAAPRAAPRPAPRVEPKLVQPRIAAKQLPAAQAPNAHAIRPVVIPKLPARLEQADDAKRAMRDRRQIVRGGGGAGDLALQQVNRWAAVRVFPVPQYTRAYDGPRTDFRETVYWNPAVETNASGDADVTFVTSDAVTAFRASAEGFSATGVAGGGQVTFQSKLPLTLDAHLPVEVTSGDTIRLPVTLANETDRALDASLDARFGAAFKLAGNPAAGAIHLKPRAKQTLFFSLEVVATDGDADVHLKLAARGLTDEIKKTIRVVPRGFPIEASASGTARRGELARQVFELAGALPGSIRASVTMYPSPLTAMTKGMEGMIREPGGCFEQTSGWRA